MVKFLTGVNNGWFADSYASDIGRNQFSGAELWHWPHSDPVPIDLTMPDPNPPTPLLTSQPQLINQYFQEVQDIDLVRIWVFERLEGIRFDPQKKIIGIDSQLLTNLTAILDAANNRGVKVYLCLFDSWVVKSQQPQGLPPHRLSNYQSWNTAVKNIMKDIVNNPHDFITNVLTPFVNHIANHPAVYAIDIMNEPEGMTQDTPVVSSSSMRNYISQCCSVIRPRLKVSVGCMRSSTAKSYSNLPIDFCDFHSYNESGNLDPYIPGSFENKLCLVGECGYPVNSSDAAARSAHEVQTAETFVNKALSEGYSACLVWNKDFTSQTNNTTIIQWLKQFASQNNQVAPPQPASPLAAFIDWLIKLFGG
jgi:hypothetical protein